MVLPDQPHALTERERKKRGDSGELSQEQEAREDDIQILIVK